MKGVRYDDLVSMVDFLYNGDANVYKENLDTFLAMAEELRLKGLKRQEDVEEQPSEKTSFCSSSQGENKTKTVHPMPKHKPSTQKSKNEMSTSPATETTIALNSSFDLEELDRKVKSMLTFNENMINNARARICTECGKEGQMILIMNHIVLHHISNICIPCNIGGNTFQTRHSLKEHVRKNHSLPRSLGQ